MIENIFIVYHLFLHFSLPSSKFPIPAGRGWSWEPGAGSISAKSNPKCKILQLYIFRFSTVELLWSERNSPDRLLQAAPTEVIHTKVRSCNSRHRSHVWQCIIMWATVVKGSCGSSFWTFDIVKHRFYRFGGVLPRARHPRHWRAFKMEILGNCASIISICVAVRHLLFPTTHWVHIIAARCSPHAATVCFHNGHSVILAAKA